MRVSYLMALLTTLGACGSSTENTQATGGSSGGGSGGTSSGGTSSGGAAGTAGSGGAAAGSGGVSGGGGISSGGAGGSGGTTATGECQPFCEAVTGAACSGGPTMAGCLLTCKTLTSSAKCDPTASTYFGCVKKSGVMCNAAGDPYGPGCGVDYLKAVDCATTENPNPAMVTPCADYCKKLTAANCQNSGTEAECNSNCKWLGAKGTGCDDEWGTFLTCTESAKFSCLLGYAVAQGCGSQFTAYSKCIDAAGK